MSLEKASHPPTLLFGWGNSNAKRANLLWYASRQVSRPISVSYIERHWVDEPPHGNMTNRRDLGFGPGLCLGRQQSLNGQHNDNKEGSQIHLGCAGVTAFSQTVGDTRGVLEWGENVPGKSSVLGVASASASPEAAKGGPSWTMTGVSGRTLSSHVEGQLPGDKIYGSGPSVRLRASSER